MAEKIVIILSPAVGLRCDIELIQFVMITGTINMKSLRRLICHWKSQYRDHKCFETSIFLHFTNILH